MSADDTPTVSRRDFVRIASGTAAASAAATGAVAQEGNETNASNATSTGTPGGNQTGGNQTGGNQTGGNKTGGNKTGGNQTGGNQTGGNQSSGGGGGAKTVSKTVTVGPGGDLTFEPETVKVTPGSTVTWKWDSDGHNVVPESQPDGANWKGHEPLEGPGFTYKHTFKKKGTYKYYCAPHKSAGMKGSVEVVDSLSTPGGGGGGPPPVPDSAKTLGVASVIGLASTLGLAYFLLRYGGDYRED